MSEQLHFRISSALKDIIGRDLITDDYIAVFELVKNSYDAYATKVDIYFENIYSDNPKIRIEDNGKGMDYDDLVNKWLFVAYSAKKEGTEDDSFDYRDSIYQHRPFAGAKGIGRFSCDRLGKQLYLETTKKKEKPKTEVLITDWGKFEGDVKEEFVDISVLHEQKDKSDYGLVHGTVLEITELRSSWSRDDLLKLKASLAKLINPSRGKGEQNFKIFLHVPEEEKNDERELEYYLKVNGEVKNFIFETLGLKTTKISANISEDGTFVTTELTDGGTLIYRIVENNTYELLDNIDISLFYLNMSAKLTFTRRMGLSSNKFGHIFLYKNGFRIYPYGEPGEDPLKIDSRKAQGYRRFLGTRDLIGQIEIFSLSNELKETSSRGDGLIKTKTYLQLEDLFWDTLKRLEKYVVDVQRWGLSIEDNDDSDIKTRSLELVAKLTDSENILHFDVNDNFFELLNQVQSESAVSVVKNLHKIAVESRNDSLIQEADKIARKLNEFRAAKEEVERENLLIEQEKKLVEEKLEIKERENQLLKEGSNDEIIELMTMEHHINQATFRINDNIRDLYQLIKNYEDIKHEAIDLINKISLENKKIASLVKFVRKANFDLLSSRVTEDLVQYIEEYIKNVYKKDRVKIINKKLIKNVNVKFDSDIVFRREFVPLEINIILDNLLDNSFKASATEALIRLKLNNNQLIIDYLDNGTGINPNIKDSIFDFGVTTTSGSGIGLYHIKKIVESMKGKIRMNEVKHGANFIIYIPQNS